MTAKLGSLLDFILLLKQLRNFAFNGQRVKTQWAQEFYGQSVMVKDEEAEAMSMIASVLHLDRPAMKALRITDAYSLHRVVYSLYDDIRNPESKATSESSGILYADQGGDYKGRKILMLANRQPMVTVDGRHAVRYIAGRFQIIFWSTASTASR